MRALHTALTMHLLLPSRRRGNNILPDCLADARTRCPFIMLVCPAAPGRRGGDDQSDLYREKASESPNTVSVHVRRPTWLSAQIISQKQIRLDDSRVTPI